MIIDRVSVERKWLAWCILLFPIAATAASEIWRVTHLPSYLLLVWEDHYLEYAEVVILAVCATLLALSGRELGKINTPLKALYLIGAILVVFVAIEEISYAQRILGIETPEYFQQNNIQNEISLHNHSTYGLKGSNDVWIVSFIALTMLYLSFAWILVPKRLFTKEWWAHFLVPSWYTCTWFMLPFMWLEFAPLGGVNSDPTPERSEIAETLFYIAATIFAYTRYIMVSAVTRPKPSPAPSTLDESSACQAEA